MGIGRILKTFRSKKILVLAVILAMLAACEKDESSVPPPVAEDEGSVVDDIPGVYEVFEINIQVENNAPIDSKDKSDYLNCTISIDGKDKETDYHGTARIRGRGNSTWLWYEKKPYRIKLDESAEILGLKKNKDWVLLANYRDPTHLMNAFGFELARRLGMPYTNNTRFVEVTLNDDYIGLYQLTEQVEPGKNRVNVDKDEGVLLSLDLDDGPSLSPDEPDNFWSSIFNMPMCVKYPQEPTVDQMNAIKNDFAELEKAVNNYDYDAVDALLDIPSFIDYLLIQEFVYNVELAAPRSVFIHKDKDGKYVMGPVWDFDAGFDFDWETMKTGHNFFNDQELVLGTRPAGGLLRSRVPAFFTQLFRNSRFVGEYKRRWKEVSAPLYHATWKSMERYAEVLQDAMARDFDRWPIDKDYNTEIDRMEEWLKNRLAYLNKVIRRYPQNPR